MISSLTPATPEWLHQYLIEPYLEGIERLNRAWRGVELYRIKPVALSLKERVISLITGIALTFFPLVNTVIWMAWQTFGTPEILSDPFTEPQNNQSPGPTHL